MAQASVCFTFVLYVVARAIRVPLTYDEAAMYIRYIEPGVLPEFDVGPLAIFNFEVATNHFLNTALAKLCTVAAGSSEVVLRAPALAGYALYLWFSARMLRELTTRPMAIAGLLLLNLNPYVLDFFALSRGYGLAVGLMTAALYYFVGSPRDVRRALMFAAAAVLANFALLNVYVALVLLSFAPAAGRAEITAHSPRRANFVLLFVAAAVFAALVFSQDEGLSPSLYRPVVVRVDGLDHADLARVTVSRVSPRGRVAKLPHVEEAADAWESAGVPVRALRVDVPASVAHKIARIAVTAGDRAFADDHDQAVGWIVHEYAAAREYESGPAISAPRSRVPAFRTVMNWTGDAHLAACLAKATALVLLLLALLAGALQVAGSLLARRGITSLARWGAVSTNGLWLAALAGPPLYLLRRDRELYFGGQRGLVEDTFQSIVESSLYGRSYHPAQSQLALAAIAGTAVLFVVTAVLTYRRKATRALAPAAWMAAVLTLVCVSLVVQHWLLGTVYLVGRTALFFVPLYVLFFIFLCEALLDCGRAGKALAASLMIAALSLSTCHFVRTANLRYALDWPDDAATKKVLADVEGIAGADRGAPHILLGVEPIYAPVAVYYAHRHVPPDIDVGVAPFPRPPDFLYLPERHAGGMQVVRTYPATHTALARVK